MKHTNLLNEFKIIKDLSFFREKAYKSKTIEELYLLATQRVFEITKCETSFIYLLTKNGNYELKYISGESEKFPLKGSIEHSIDEFNEEEVKAFLIDEIERSTSLSVAPLKTHIRLFGFIGMINEAENFEAQKIALNEIAEITSLLAASKKKIDKLNFIFGAFEKVRQGKDKKEIFQLLANKLTGESSKFNACLIHLYDKVRNNLYGFVSSGIEHKLEPSSRIGIEASILGEVFEKGEIKIIRVDVESFSHYKWARQNGFVSMIVVPLKSFTGERYGTLSLYTKYNYLEDENDNKLINIFLKQTSILIDSILHEQRIKKLSYVDDIISQIIPIGIEKEDILRIILKESLSLLGGEIGYISLFSKKTNLIIPTCKLDISGKFSDFNVPDSLVVDKENSISGWVVKNEKGYLFPSIESIDILFAPYKNLNGAKIESELVVPFIYEKKVIGVIVISSTSKHAFDLTDLEFLEKTVEKAAQIIQSKVFYDASKELTNEIFEHLDEEKICLSAAQITNKALDTSVCCVWLLVNEKGIDCLSLIGWDGCKIDNPSDMKIEKNQDAISWRVIDEVQSGKEEHLYGTYHGIDTIESGFLHIKFARRYNLKSMRSTPIMHNKQVIGLINSYTNRNYEFFDTEKVLLKSISNRTASALFNAKWEKMNIIANPGIIALAFVHDITHQMQYLTSNIEVLKDFLPERLKKQDAFKNTLDAVDENMGSLRKSFDSLIRIAKRAKAQKKKSSLKLILEDVDHLFKSTFEHKNIHFAFSLENLIEGESDIVVKCFANEIEQVLDNLILNSIFALNKISHRKKEIRIAIKDNIEMDGKQWVKLEVYDTGKGISKENMDKIYNMDFSTKGEEGSGLGLSICKRIIENNHQGKLFHDSEENKWTRFYIYLPIVDEKK